MLKAIHLEPHPFDMERDLITPTFKLKRPQLLKHYKVLSDGCHFLSNLSIFLSVMLEMSFAQDCIDQLYNEAKGLKA